jgi:hypothetical protein
MPANFNCPACGLTNPQGAKSCQACSAVFPDFDLPPAPPAPAPPAPRFPRPSAAVLLRVAVASAVLSLVLVAVVREARALPPPEESRSAEHETVISRPLRVGDPCPMCFGKGRHPFYVGPQYGGSIWNPNNWIYVRCEECGGTGVYNPALAARRQFIEDHADDIPIMVLPRDAKAAAASGDPYSIHPPEGIHTWRDPESGG